MGFSGEQVMGIVSLLLVLVFWIIVLRNERAHTRWLNDALVRREEERQRKTSEATPAPEEDSKRSGPWG